MTIFITPYRSSSHIFCFVFFFLFFCLFSFLERSMIHDAWLKMPQYTVHVWNGTIRLERERETPKTSDRKVDYRSITQTNTKKNSNSNLCWRKRGKMSERNRRNDAVTATNIILTWPPYLGRMEGWLCGLIQGLGGGWSHPESQSHRCQKFICSIFSKTHMECKLLGVDYELLGVYSTC